MEDYIKEAQEQLLTELHYYAKWILENPHATPLERRARKNGHAELIPMMLTETRKKWLEEEIEKLQKSRLRYHSDAAYCSCDGMRTALSIEISRLEAELKALDK